MLKMSFSLIFSFKKFHWSWNCLLVLFLFFLVFDFYVYMNKLFLVSVLDCSSHFVLWWCLDFQNLPSFWPTDHCQYYPHPSQYHNRCWNHIICHWTSRNCCCWQRKPMATCSGKFNFFITMLTCRCVNYIWLYFIFPI